MLTQRRRLRRYFFAAAGEFPAFAGLIGCASARSARLASRCAPAAVSHTKAVIGRYVTASMWLPSGGGS